jgi:PPOX class probable F420-dependent enzyme
VVGENARVSEPSATRPYMPGYGIQAADEGSGLLPWAWAQERLAASRNYWVATVWPDGRPHAMPVWGVWDGEAFWFSSSLRSRKARNLAADPRCVVTTEDANEPVVLEGIAAIVAETDAIEGFLALMNAKYRAGMTLAFLDPAVNATIRVRPHWAFGIAHDDFTGSPTRWTFTS